MGKLHSTYRWQQKRRRQLEAHPLCAWCLREGRYVAASVAHHETPHRDDPALFWSTPLISLCKLHHDSDAQAIEKGGKPKQRIGADGWPVENERQVRG